MVNNRGRERVLKIAARRGDSLTINEVGAPSYQSSILTLQARAISDGLAIQSMLLTSGSQTMSVSFKPELSLAALSNATGSVETDFQIDQGKAKRIAHGVIILDRQEGEALRLRWRPKAPDWATGRALETTIRLTIAAHMSGYAIESAQVR